MLDLSSRYKQDLLGRHWRAFLNGAGPTELPGEGEGLAGLQGGVSVRQSGVKRELGQIHPGALSGALTLRKSLSHL